MRFRYIIQAGARKGWLPFGCGAKLHDMIKDIIASGIPSEQISITVKAVSFTIDAEFEVVPEMTTDNVVAAISTEKAMVLYQ